MFERTVAATAEFMRAHSTFEVHTPSLGQVVPELTVRTFWGGTCLSIIITQQQQWQQQWQSTLLSNTICKKYTNIRSCKCISLVGWSVSWSVS